MKLVLAAIAAICLAGVIALGVVGARPSHPSGPHPVTHEVRRIEITGRSQLDGAVSQLPIDVGLWRPKRGAAPGSMPLVIYAPGWGSSFGDNVALMEALASNGYGVIAISDIGIGPRPPWYTADDDGARLAPFDISTPERQAQFTEDADRRVALAAARIAHVLDAINRAQATDTTFAAFNLDVVGAIGASFGGASVAEAALDGRFAIAINLDGLVFGRAQREVIPRPYLEFNSSIGVVPISEAGSGDPVRRFLAQTNIQQIARQDRQHKTRIDAFDITIRGMRHQDFTDELHGWQRLMSWRPWRERPLRPARARYIIDTLVVAALDEWIGRKFGTFTDLDRKEFPEVEFIGGKR